VCRIFDRKWWRGKEAGRPAKQRPAGGQLSSVAAIARARAQLWNRQSPAAVCAVARASVQLPALVLHQLSDQAQHELEALPRHEVVYQAI